MNFLKATIDLPPKEELKIRKLLRERAITKGTRFIREGEVPKRNYSDWQVLKAGDPCWNHLLVKMLEKALPLKKPAKENSLCWMHNIVIEISKEF